MKNNKVKVPRRIARQLIMATVLFSTVITLITTAYQLYGNYSEDISLIELRLEEIKNIHLRSLSKQVWVSDPEEIQVLLDNLLNLPRMNYLEVLEGNEIKVSSGKRLDEDVIERSYAIFYEHRDENLLIGRLNVQASLDEVYQSLINQAWVILVSNAIKTFLVTGFIFFLFEFLVTRHLHRISDFATKLDLTNLKERLTLARKSNARDNPDELDVVVNAIDVMQENLQVSVEKLHQRDAYIRLINDSIASAIFGINLKGECTFVNRMCRTILGYDEAELLGKNIHALIHDDREDARPCTEANCSMLHVLNPEATKHTSEWHKTDEVLKRKDGSHFFAEYWIHPIKQDGAITGFVVSFIDISDRHAAQKELAMYQGHLEKLVAERTTELQQMYDELESFSYSVSHDLRAPLRAINGFSLIIKEDKEDQLDDEGLALLDKVCVAAENMGSLIDSLLSLSRITRTELNIKKVNVSRLARIVLSDLVKSRKLNDIELNIDDEISIFADDKLIQIVLENLCANAVKFSAEQSKTSIKVGKIVNGQSITVFVQDNGVGFDTKYIDQLFKPFQRLHDADDFPGHGIGLATVARIIKRHHGRVWAESSPDQGATFYLEFPLNP